MSRNEDAAREDTDSVHDCVDLNPTVQKIFDGILDGPMEEFKQPLEFIKENKFRAVWREDTERHEKVMSYAKTFLQAITTSFPSKYAEAAKHIEGSTCDLFLQYVHDKLDESLLGQDPFHDSCKKVHQSITRSLLRIKDKLEKKCDEQPEQKSDLEDMISKTDLLDPIHIHHALLCCQVASDCKYPEHKQKSLEKFEKEHLLSDLYVSYENEQVPKYVMARCGNVLYVCFKGVQSHNLGRTERSYRGEICKGVSEAAQKIPLKYFAREIMQNKRIVFSGHSNGGAVASLVFLFLLEKFKNQEEIYLKSNFKCITFGLMPLADNMLKHYIRAIPGAQDCFCHIVQKNDIVPKLFGSFNMTAMESKLWELVESILQPLKPQDPAFGTMNHLLQPFLQFARGSINNWNRFARFDHLDIFGKYFILDTEAQGQKYLVLPAEQAATLLRINDAESLRNIQSQYFINHQLERYAHEVELTFTRELPNLKNFKNTRMAVADDIKPKITHVLFENIGEEVVAKIYGSNMWFVHNVSIEGILDGSNLNVDVMKSTECEVQTRMRETNICHQDTVSVRVKTHFENSKYLPPAKVPATENTYRVTRRQQQLAKHSPRAVMELAYLSALLERRQEGHYSKRFEAIKKFFETAVSVVPLESLFHAMANAKLDVMVQCCKILCSCDTLSIMDFSSQWLLSSMERVSSRLALTQQCLFAEMFAEELYNPPRIDFDDDTERLDYELMRLPAAKRREYYQLFNKTYSAILPLVGKYRIQREKRLRPPSPCNTDLEVIYPSVDVKGPQKPNETRCKAPLNLLTEGRKKLNRLSEELIAERSEYSDENATSNTNIKMLSVLTNLRKEFETCGTLLGAFMESRAQIPLDKAGGDKYVNKFAKHASSMGLSVWGLLIVPFEYLNRLIISNLSEDFRQFVVEFSHHIRGVRNYIFPPSEHQFPDYDERLEFLVGSMKQSWACNQQYVSYSLERQLRMECENRNIHHFTSVDDILEQWNANFEDERLTLVPEEYRRLVARWIRWSLMINDLRESLASQTAVGVIGLVNSGKSKFVRSLFGRETITGTTDQKRTTVPLIYNVGQSIKGMDVIDFPGVDDRDKSIPELAELLLSLTRIIVFVVDYRRAHTESTKEWLSILEKEDVPVLICLTFADKLFAELMGENGDYDVEKVKLRVQKQLETIKKQIGQPKSGHQRDFKLAVFSFDNDSKLNTEEGKEKLRKAGLNDELDVGRWIAEKFLDYEQNEISQNVIKFIRGKEKSTLNSNKHAAVQVSPTEEKIREAPAAKRKRSDEERAGDDEQPTCSKRLYNPL